MHNKYDREREDEQRRWRDEREPPHLYADDEERYGARGQARGGRFGDASARTDYHPRASYPREWRSERELRGLGQGGREAPLRRDHSNEREVAEYRYWSGRDDADYRPSYERQHLEEEPLTERAHAEGDPYRGRYGSPGGLRDPSRGGLYGYGDPSQAEPRQMGAREPGGGRWASDPGAAWRESDRRRAFSPNEGAERYRQLGGHAGKGPKGYVRSDERIREDVCDRLSDDDEVDASEISVSVNAGEVLLEGTVIDRHSKHRAEDIAEAVSGVRDVSNHLRTRKNIVQELGDKILGGREHEHHGHSGSGTRNSPSGFAPTSSQGH